jgi:hypothetical protein
VLFTFVCHDRPGCVELRQQTRVAHLAYIDALQERLVLAGPHLADDGATPIGSLLVVECSDRAAAEAFAAADPYALAGLFQSVEIRPFRKARPASA